MQLFMNDHARSLVGCEPSSNIQIECPNLTLLDLSSMCAVVINTYCGCWLRLEVRCLPIAVFVDNKLGDEGGKDVINALSQCAQLNTLRLSSPYYPSL